MLLYIALAPVLVPLLYTLLSSTMRPRTAALRNKHITLLIAHPDDEAMFFAPTVLALARPSTGNRVKILCLSTGDADGLGDTRRRELKKSGMRLGLRSEDDIVVLDDSDLPDSMTTTWPQSKIVDILSRHPTDVLITFDAHGISSHPNHKSLFHGARAFLAQAKAPLDLYTLTTVGFARKYSSLLDLFTTRIMDAAADATQSDGAPDNLLFVSNLSSDLPTAWKAMTEAHASQMRWFRYGWIVLSRYMVVNELRRETV